MQHARRYLSLHHREKDSNFCLFMPIFDLLGGTLNSKSWQLQKEIYQGTYKLRPDHANQSPDRGEDPLVPYPVFNFHSRTAVPVRTN